MLVDLVYVPAFFHKSFFLSDISARNFACKVIKMFLYFNFIKECPNYKELKAIVPASVVRPSFKESNPLKTKYFLKCGCSTKCSGSIGFFGSKFFLILQQIQLLKKSSRKSLCYFRTRKTHVNVRGYSNSFRKFCED